MRITLLTVIACAGWLQAPTAPVRWEPLTSGVTARLRGVSAASDTVVWASGADGTVIRTADGGTSWQRLQIPGAGQLDFRDIDAVDERTAYVLSIGPGDRSRIYKTSDAGASWAPQFVNEDPEAFFDAMAFWDADRGVAFSDSVDGRFVILTTSDGGRTWTGVPAAALPPALPDEGAFAASGTNVAVHGSTHLWIGTGAAAQARVLRSTDGGRTWSVTPTPLAAGPSSGIFSIAFRDARQGIVVGGDFRRETEATDNAAITTDGGATWTPVTGLSGYRSVAAWVPRSRSSVVAIGPSGTDYSEDGGRSWIPIEGPGFHAFSFAPGGSVGFAVGEEGAIGRLVVRR